jgi:hypothetical protein
MVQLQPDGRHQVLNPVRHELQIRVQLESISKISRGSDTEIVAMTPVGQISGLKRL